MSVIYWTPHGLAAPPNNLGIAIVDPPEDRLFQKSAQQALAALALVKPGQQLINGILGQLTPVGQKPLKRIAIRPWNKRGENYCVALPRRDSGEDPLTPLARALFSNDAPAIAREMTLALKAMGRNSSAGRAKIAQQINRTPDCQLEGEAAWLPVNLGVTGDVIHAWASGGAPLPLPMGMDKIDFLRHALLIALEPGMRPGAGCSTRVNWNPGLLTIREEGEERPRPPYIALAHELAHAYRDLSGTQIGLARDAPSTALYEYTAVGLGPWQNPPNLAAMVIPPLTENSVRAAFGLNPRQQYL